MTQNGHFTNNSVIVEPPESLAGSGPMGDFIFRFATVADDIPKWGYQPSGRDWSLRGFWPTEPVLASAVTSTAAKYAALGWTLEGPKRVVKQMQTILNWSENGQGWNALMIKTVIDMITQDNGAFIEVVRSGNKPTDPVVMLNHLDSARCIRTGRHEEPVVYWDAKNNRHLLKWWQVLPIAEMPSPIEAMRGMQYSAVTRMLLAAQIMRDIGIYHKEKIGGRFNKAVVLVGGVQKRSIEDAFREQQQQADDQGLIRYIQPLIIAALDPTSTVSKQVIELASLPDHFDYEVFMRWYINQLALAFMTDYQEFAPLPAGNLGTSQQSQILHMKSRGKGPANFMSMIEHFFNFYGIMPRNVHFTYGFQDTAEDSAKEELRLKRAQRMQTYIASGVVTKEVVTQMLVDVGDLDEVYLNMMGLTDQTGDIKAGDIVPVGLDSKVVKSVAF